MTTWSERRWWHYVVPAGVLAISFFLGFIYGFPEGEFTYDTILIQRLITSGILSAFAAAIVVTVAAQFRIHYVGGCAALVLVGPNGRVLKAGLNTIFLKPWPFRTRFTVKEYPTAFAFEAALNPITANPKVIPLSVEVTVELADHAEVPDWFLGYLEDPNRAVNEFRRQAFEIFQHRLPQDLASRLNPFDGGASAEALKGFVVDRLSLPFRHRVKNFTLAMAN